LSLFDLGTQAVDTGPELSKGHTQRGVEHAKQVPEVVPRLWRVKARRGMVLSKAGAGEHAGEDFQDQRQPVAF
jgi:hypothetical protein